MTEEVKEVIDYKKIGIIAIICIGFAGLIFIVLSPILSIQLPQLNLPQIQEDQTEKTDQIKPEYQKYLELGISKDDVLDFQTMSCSVFNTPELLSTDTKYTSIIEQKKIECNI